MDNNHITKQIRNLSLRLSKSLTSIDIQNGWTEQAQDALLLTLLRLENDIDNQISVYEVAGHGQLVRGLDHWGVGGGELLKGFVELSNAIRQVGEAS